MDNRLKIKENDFSELRNAIKAIPEENKKMIIDNYNNLLKNGIVKTMTALRFSFFHAINTRENNFCYSRKLSDYLTDKQIESALRLILSELNIE